MPTDAWKQAIEKLKTISEKDQRADKNTLTLGTGLLVTDDGKGNSVPSIIDANFNFNCVVCSLCSVYCVF